MRIRVGVRVHLPQDGTDREGGDEEEMDNDDVSRMQPGRGDHHCSAAFAAGGATGTTPAAQGSFSPAVPARKTKGLEHTSSEVRYQRRQSIWLDVADFWYFADARQVPTIGSLKQQLLQSLLQGEFAMPPAAAAVLSSLTCNFLCGAPRVPRQCSNCCDFFWQRSQMPLCRRVAPTVVLRLQGALLPDSQPLYLVENGDHVELCVSHSSLPPVPSESPRTLKAGAEACTFVSHSCPRWHSAPFKEGALDAVYMSDDPLASYMGGTSFLRKSRVAGSCGIHVSGCSRKHCTSGDKLEGKGHFTGGLESQKKRAATPLQQQMAKGRRVQQLRTEDCHASPPSTQHKPGELAVRLPAVTPAVGTSSIPSAYTRALSTVAKKKAKERAYLSRRRATSMTVSTTRSKSRRSSTTSSSSGGHGNNSRRSSECGGMLHATPEARGPAAGADRSIAVKRNQGSPVPLGCSTGKAASGGPAGAAPAPAEKERRYAVDNLASSMKGTHSKTAATAAAIERAKAAAIGDCPVASVRKPSSEKVVRWPDTAAAGRLSGVVSIQQSSSEEERSSDTEGDVRQARLARQKAKEVPRSGAAAAAETQATLPQKQQQQAQQTIGKPRVVRSRTGGTDSEDSSSDASSTENSNSSSSEDDACNGRGTSKGVSRLRGRMPAAVAKAAAASATRPAATAHGLQEERETHFKQGRKVDDLAVAGGPASVRQPQSDRSVHKVGFNSSGSQVRATADCSSTCGGAHSAGGAGEAPCVPGQGVHANEKRFARQQQRGESQQQQVGRQRQQQQEKRRQPHQPQGEKEHERGASWQLLLFKPCKDPSLATVQRGEWLRVRLLHLVNGMPTLDAWKTVFVEATDVPAGRIKLWELRQQRAAGGAGNSTGGSSSNAGGSHINAGGNDMLEGECTVQVPFRKTAGNQKGGAGRWYDWSELACVSTAAGVETAKHAEVTASMGTAATAATAPPSSSAAAAALPAVATTLRDGGDNAGKRAIELTTDTSETASAANVAAKSAGSTVEGALSAESSQRPSPLLRYLPRRLLSLRQQTLDGDHATEGERAAGVTEPMASHSNANKTSGGTTGICLQLDSPESSSSSSWLQGNSGATLLSAKKADRSCVETVMLNGVPNGDAESACDVVLKQKAAEASDGATASGATTRVGDSSRAAQEIRYEAASSGCAAGDASQLIAAAAEKAGCSRTEGAISDSPAAARTTTEQSSTNAVGYGGASTGLSTADCEKEQWEALVAGGIEIFFNEDEDVLVASHPAVPTATFRLPLPRDLVQECSRRLEAASHSRKNIGNKEHSSTSASCSSGGHSNTTASAPSAHSNATGISDVQQVELCTEEPSQQQRGGEDCTEETAVSEKNVTAETSSLSSSNGNIKRVVAPEIWKDFDCVKACARRVVGEQLQHTRRTLRRQVDYYFSPGNWHKDVYLRSRAVPLTSIRCSNDSAAGDRSSRGSSDSFSGCAAEDASVNTQENTETAATSTTAGTGSIVTVGDTTASNASSNWGSQKERVREGKVAVNLDEILTFPRMRGLSRDREFVAWCIRSGGGLQHVALETRGETHWLIRKGAAEATLQHSMTTKAAKQQ